MSIRSKLIFGVAIALLTCIGAMLWLNIAQVKGLLDRYLIDSALPANATSIAREIDAELTAPITAAGVIADTTLMQDWAKRGEPEYEKASVTEFLSRVREQLGAHAAFFIPRESGNYYSGEGLVRTIDRQGQGEDDWFYDFLDSGVTEHYNLDHDKADNTFALYINRRVEANGEPLGIAGIGMGMSTMSNLIRDFRFGDNGIVYLVSQDGDIVIHPNESKVDMPMTGLMPEPAMQSLLQDDSADDGVNFTEYQQDGTDYVALSTPLSFGGWSVVMEVPSQQIYAAMHQATWRSLLTGLAIAIAFLGLTYWGAIHITKPIRRIADAMRDIAEGRGDLTRRLTVESNDEVGNLATQFNAFVSRMQETLLNVRRSSASVFDASGHMSQSADELATRTEQAAANLQQTSASMEEITSTVTHSADNAQQANQLVLSTAEIAKQGEEAMDKVEITMRDINDSATRIGEIITMIDAIAFQTNILALNASVEAARAGEHGRGFAVVAQEVRTLASRSSEASSEIRALIDTSVKHTQSGAELVNTANGTMHDIAASVQRVTDVIGEITAGTKEQSAGIGQINTAVAEMDTMTQQNATMVQESTTAAADMRRHAEHLSGLINTFVLGEETADAGLKRPALSSDAAPPARQAPARTAVTSAEDDWEEF